MTRSGLGHALNVRLRPSLKTRHPWSETGAGGHGYTREPHNKGLIGFDVETRESLVRPELLKHS